MNDDPRLTDFAVDELDGSRGADLERRLEADPELREALEATRATIGSLTSAWDCAPALRLAAGQREAILRAAGAAPRPARRIPRLLRPLAFAAGIAAAVLVAATAGPPFEEATFSGPASPDEGVVSYVVPEFMGSTVNPSRAEAEVDWALGTLRQWTTTLAAGAFTVEQPTAGVQWSVDLNTTAALRDLKQEMSDRQRAQLLVRPAGETGPDLGRILPLYFETVSLPVQSDGVARFTVPRDLAAGSRIAGRLLDGAWTYANYATDTAPASRFRNRTGHWTAGRSAGTAEPFVATTDDPDSSFPLGIAPLSYGYVRHLVRSGQRPSAEHVHVDELVNAFDYADLAALTPDPDTAGDTLVQVASCPWAPGNRLVRVGVHTNPPATPAEPSPANFVFVVDTAEGGEQADPQLPIVRQSIRLFLSDLNRDDQVALVTYDDQAKLRVAPTPTTSARPLLAALDSLEPTTSAATAVSMGQAFDLAQSNFRSEAVNHVVLATRRAPVDAVKYSSAVLGNVKDADGLRVRLAVLALGRAEQPDLVRIAAQNHGRFATVTSATEAREVLRSERRESAEDERARPQVRVEFNPLRASSYRLLGFAPRAETVAGASDAPTDRRTTTALYEVVPTTSTGGANGAVLGFAVQDWTERQLVKVRLRSLSRGTRRETVRTADDAAPRIGDVPADFRFATAVAGYGLVLRGTLDRSTYGLGSVAELAAGAAGDSSERRELVELVRATDALLDQPVILDDR